MLDCHACILRQQRRHAANSSVKIRREHRRGTIWATQHLIATNPKALRGFLGAWLEAIDYTSQRKADTVKIESEITGYFEV
jgi:ABC-type nitrate/sulfonate/bicarbonate transport system substrate-binding protein